MMLSVRSLYGMRPSYRTRLFIPSSRRFGIDGPKMRHPEWADGVMHLPGHQKRHDRFSILFSWAAKRI